MFASLERAGSKLGFLIGKLDALSPLLYLLRGYGIIKSEEKGIFVKSVNDVDVGEGIEVSVKDGSFTAR